MKKINSDGLRIVLRTIKDDEGYSYQTHMVVGRDADGKRLRKCFKSREQASAFLAAMHTKLLNAETAVNAVMTRLTAAQMRQAEAAFNSLGSRYSLDEAVSYFLANYAAPAEAVTLDAAITAFGLGKTDVRKNSLRSIKSTIQRFRDYLRDVEGFDNVELHNITDEHVSKFLGSLRAKDGMSPASKKTFNNYRNDISSLLTWCMHKSRRWVGKNVAREVEMFKKEELRKADVPETLKPKQALAVMQAAANHEPSLAKVYALMLFAGIRPDDDGELFKLARHLQPDDMINLRTRKIRITPEMSKVKRLRTVPISDNLLAWLKQDGPILPTNAARHIKAFRQDQELSGDVCRHTFCTNHAATHGSLSSTALVSGNSEGIIRDHYADHVTKAEAAPFWRIYPDAKEGAVIRPLGQAAGPKKKQPKKSGKTASAS
jgi:integrase